MISEDKRSSLLASPEKSAAEKKKRLMTDVSETRRKLRTSFESLQPHLHGDRRAHRRRRRGGVSGVRTVEPQRDLHDVHHVRHERRQRELQPQRAELQQ